MSALRVTLTLPGSGVRTFELAIGKSVTIGSAPPASVVFESRDPEIAPVHVRLSVTDRGLEAFQEAPGGFAVNGRKAKRAALRDGDALQMGASTLKVAVAVIPPAGAPPAQGAGHGPPGTGHAGHAGAGHGAPATGHGAPGSGPHAAHGHAPHAPRAGEKPVVVLDSRPVVGGPPPLVTTAQAALAGAAGAGVAQQALAGATGSIAPPGAPPGAAPPAGGPVIANKGGFVVVDALAPPPLHEDERDREREKTSKHTRVEETRRAAELMFGTPMRGSALAQHIAIEKPDAGLSFHVAPLGHEGADKTPLMGDKAGPHKTATGSQKVAVPGAPGAAGSPYAMDALGGEGGTSRRVLRGTAALAAVPGAAAALGGHVPEKAGLSARTLPPRVEAPAADGGAHVIGGASTGEDLLHLLLFIETRSKSGTLIVRAPAQAGGLPLEGRLSYRNGSIVARVPISIADPPFAWLVTVATLPLVEFRFVFAPPPRAEGEHAAKVSALIEQVIQRLST